MAKISFQFTRRHVSPDTSPRVWRQEARPQFCPEDGQPGSRRPADLHRGRQHRAAAEQVADRQGGKRQAVQGVRGEVQRDTFLYKTDRPK